MAEEIVVPLHIRRTRSAMDMATVAGILCAFGLIAVAIIIGGSPASFVNTPAILIVIGGTLAVTTACFSLDEMRRTFRVVMKTVFYSSRDPSDAAIQVLKIAEMARKDGVLALQNVLSSIQAEPFLLKGVSMVVDGFPAARSKPSCAATCIRPCSATPKAPTCSANWANSPPPWA